MSLKEALAKLLTIAPSATAEGVTVETANMPSTPLTKMAMYIIANALWARNRFKDDRGLSKALIRKVEAIFDFTTAEKYGFKPIYFKNATAVSLQQRSSAIKTIVKNLANDPNISNDEVTALKQAVLFLEKPDDETRLRNTRKLAAKLSVKFGDNVGKVVNSVSDAEEETEDKLTDLVEKLHDVVKAMTGRVGVKVDTKTLSSPKNVSNKVTYRRLRREIANLYDETLVHFLASKEQNIAYVHEVYKHMEGLGFPFHKVPVFNKKVPLKITMHAGKIQYLTDSEKPLSASIPAGATKIKFMSTYDEKTGKGAYLSYTAPEAVSITRVYTKDHKVAAVKSKFGKADQVVQNIDGYLTRWHKDLISKDPYKRMGATIALIVYETGMRAGTRQRTAASATGVPTYGALSLRPRHVRISGTSIIFKYEGKKGVAQEHKIMLNSKWNKLIAKNLKEFKEDKRGDDLIFSFINERGTTKPMAPNRMTAYLNSTGYTVGLHKIRHVKGTSTVIELLGKLKFKPSTAANRSLSSKQREAEEFIKSKIIMPVAALLGHKNKDKLAWRTSIGSYINPAPIAAFFEEHQLRIPKWLPNKVEE